MQHRFKKREILMEISLLFVLFIPVFTLFYNIDIFDRTYEFTRAHEEWELDEIIAFVVAFCVSGTVLAFRYMFVMTKLLNDLMKANEELVRNREEKIQAEKMIALGNLAGGLAHEINNALQPVLGLSEAMRNSFEEKDDLKAANYLSKIHESALHARNIVSDVLIFARKGQKEKKRFDLPHLLVETFDITGLSLSPDVTINIDAVKNSMDEGYPVFIDKTGMLQVIVNLFTNAAYAMQGTGEIKIGLEKRHMNGHEEQLDLLRGDYAVLSIKDTGEGMKQDVIERLFEPFFTTKPIGIGTGLGLSTIYGIIRDWGGSIRVESAEGAGTTFYLYIPLDSNTKEEKAGMHNGKNTPD